MSSRSDLMNTLLMSMLSDALGGGSPSGRSASIAKSSPLGRVFQAIKAADLDTFTKLFTVEFAATQDVLGIQAVLRELAKDDWMAGAKVFITVVNQGVSRALLKQAGQIFVATHLDKPHRTNVVFFCNAAAGINASRSVSPVTVEFLFDNPETFAQMLLQFGNGSADETLLTTLLTTPVFDTARRQFEAAYNFTLLQYFAHFDYSRLMAYYAPKYTVEQQITTLKTMMKSDTLKALLEAVTANDAADVGRLYQAALTHAVMFPELFLMCLEHPAVQLTPELATAYARAFTHLTLDSTIPYVTPGIQISLMAVKRQPYINGDNVEMSTICEELLELLRSRFGATITPVPVSFPELPADAAPAAKPAPESDSGSDDE